MSTLRDSAYRVVEMYGAERSDHRIAQNHITLSHIVACCVALVYTLTEYEGSPTNLKLLSWRRRALQHIESAEMYMTAFCSHSDLANQYPDAFRRLTRPVHTRIKEADEAGQSINSTILPALEGFVGSMPDTTREATLFDPLSIFVDQQQQPQLAVSWADHNDALGTINPEDGSTNVMADNFDDIFASFGLGAFST